MNNATYILKYTEYLIRKCRSFLMTDLYFHTAVSYTHLTLPTIA